MFLLYQCGEYNFDRAYSFSLIFLGNALVLCSIHQTECKLNKDFTKFIVVLYFYLFWKLFPAAETTSKSKGSQEGRHQCIKQNKKGYLWFGSWDT